MTRTQNHDPKRPDPNLHHFYRNGDVYDALDALDDLRLKVGRLKRQGLLAHEDLIVLGESLGAIHSLLDTKIVGNPTHGNEVHSDPTLDS